MSEEQAFIISEPIIWTPRYNDHWMTHPDTQSDMYIDGFVRDELYEGKVVVLYHSDEHIRCDGKLDRPHFYWKPVREEEG